MNKKTMHRYHRLHFGFMLAAAIVPAVAGLLALGGCGGHNDQVARAVESYVLTQKQPQAHATIDSFTFISLQQVSHKELLEAVRDYYREDATRFQRRKTVDSAEWTREVKVHDSLIGYFNALPEYNKIDTNLSKTVHNSYLLDSGYVAASMHAGDSAQALAYKADGASKDCFAAVARYGLSTPTASEVHTIEAYLDEHYKVVLLRPAR